MKNIEKAVIILCLSGFGFSLQAQEEGNPMDSTLEAEGPNLGPCCSETATHIEDRDVDTNIETATAMLAQAQNIGETQKESEAKTGEGVE